MSSADQKKTTDYLQAHHHGAADESAWIYKRFINQARKLAREKLSLEIQVRAKPTEIANSSLFEALANLQKDAKWAASSDEFLKKLLGLVVSRAQDAARANTAQKRSVAREEPSSAERLNGQMESRVHEPIEEVICDEFANDLANILLEEDDEVDRMINVLGILCDFEAGNIREVLLQSFSAARIPATRTIQSKIQRAREKATRRLCERYPLDSKDD